MKLPCVRPQEFLFAAVAITASPNSTRENASVSSLPSKHNLFLRPCETDLPLRGREEAREEMKCF